MANRQDFPRNPFFIGGNEVTIEITDDSEPGVKVFGYRLLVIPHFPSSQDLHAEGVLLQFFLSEFFKRWMFELLRSLAYVQSTFIKYSIQNEPNINQNTEERLLDSELFGGGLVRR